MNDALAIVRQSGTIAFPALIAVAGDRAVLRFLEFFTVNIRNPNTRGRRLRSCAGAKHAASAS